MEELKSRYEEDEHAEDREDGDGAEKEKRAERALGLGGEDVYDYNDDEDDWYAIDEEEEEVLRALDWLDLVEDMSAASGGSAATAGVSLSGHDLRSGAYGPNSQRRQQQQQQQEKKRNISKKSAAASSKATMQPRAAQQASRFASLINVGQYSGKAGGGGQRRLDNRVENMLREKERRGTNNAARGRDKADRATVEQALDPRTRMVLFKMLNRRILSEINGCVSTGKEANVYHATTPEGGDLAVKVYKTSILVFKDRDRYVTGDRRFSNGYGKGNPRKMVKTWAEKEYRNLLRLRAAGIRSPAPTMLRMHVLLMEFIGRDGWAAPRLKDVQLKLSKSKMTEMYLEALTCLRVMFQVCRLVHADFSEYNILYFEGHLYFIDVSQGVELDHPRALDFLREDCTHINAFFNKSGTVTLSLREVFDFVTEPMAAADDEDGAVRARLEKLMEAASVRPIMSVEQEVQEAVFKGTFIPRTMEEIVHFERDHKRLAGAGSSACGSATDERAEGYYFQKMMGMRDDMRGVREGAASVSATREENEPRGHSVAAAGVEGGDDSDASDGGGSGGESGSDDDDDDEGSDGSGGVHPRDAKLTPEQVKEMRRANKAKVKEENKERRQNKVPKKVKKRKQKIARSKHSGNRAH